jgi:spore germination protein
MIIHIVQQGDTMGSIADSYGVPEERLILENDITNPDKLTIGQTIVIVYPEQTYTIQEGDTLQGIADYFDVSIMQILRNNPYLSEREYIYPDETIVISYKDEKKGTLSINGYAYTFINMNTLEKALPFLTYLTIYSYIITEGGELNDIDDTEIIQIAKEYGVMPIMMITGLSRTPEREDNIADNIIMNPELQDRLINNVLNVLKNKGYLGVNIPIPYIQPSVREFYMAFIEKFSKQIMDEGYFIMGSLIYNTFEVMTGMRYDDIFIKKLGQVLDKVMVIAYDWGVSLGSPAISIAIASFRSTLEYIISIIPSDKVTFGLSSIGYIWELPYVAGVSVGQSISYNAALELAYEYGAEIRYNEVSTSSVYQYISFYEHIVQIRDARGLVGFTDMFMELELDGMGLWNIMSFPNQEWLVINTQYNIKRI